MTKKRASKAKSGESKDAAKKRNERREREPMFNTIDFNSEEPCVVPLSVGGLYFMLADAFGEDGLPQR